MSMQQSVLLPILIKAKSRRNRTMQLDRRPQQNNTPSPSTDPCEQSRDPFFADEDVICRHATVPITIDEANAGNYLQTQIECSSLDGTQSPRIPIVADDNVEVPQQNDATILIRQSPARRYARAGQHHDSELPNVHPPPYSLIMTEGLPYSNIIELGLDESEPQIRQEQSQNTMSGSTSRLLGEPTHGIIRLTMRNCAEIRHMGLAVQAIDNGVFVSQVEMGSPADLAGLRFGDQILSIDRIAVAGYSRQDVKKLLRRIDRTSIPLVVRDRPYERSIMLQKDLSTCYGLRYLNGRILSIAKGSPAATEGLQLDQQITSVNGSSVIGLSDSQLWNCINEHEDGVSISFVPHNIYKRLIRKISLSELLGRLKWSLLNI